MTPELVAYNIPVAYALSGPLDRPALQRAVETVVDRHESLRTRFVVVEEAPRQKVVSRAESGFRLDYRDLRGQADREEQVGALALAEANFTFDLAAGPLFRASLVQLEDERHVLLYTLHHIIADLQSLQVLAGEVGQLYKAGTRGEANPLSPLRIQYRDFAVWQHQQLTEAQLPSGQYWLEQMSGELPVLELPTDFSRPAVKSYQGNRLDVTVDQELVSGLGQLAQRQEATLFMVLLASVKTLLYRYSGQDDIIVGSPVAGREHADLEDQIGFYVNILPLRTQFSGQDGFEQLLARVKTVALGAYQHQRYPFDELVEKLQPKRNLSRSPLFDVSVVLQNLETTGHQGPRLENLTVHPYRSHNNSSKFDLTFTFVVPPEGGLSLQLEYNSELFEQGRMERLLNHYQQLLRSILTHPGQAISRLEWLAPEEKTHLLDVFNRTQAGYPAGETLVSLFEAQVRKTPDAVAVVFEDQQLTYGQLNEKADRVARVLAAQGVQPEAIVGVLLERSLEMIAALLGVLKAGAAYLPIDPAHPAGRIRYMLQDSGARLLLTTSNLPVHQFPPDCPLIYADQLERYQAGPLAAAAPQPGHGAYVIYTSGTTGQPKGVLVEHRQVVRLMVNDAHPFDFNAQDVWTMFHAYGFDFSVWEMYGALLYGGTLVVVPPPALTDPELYLKLLKARGVTVLNQTPSAFTNIAGAEEHSPQAALRLRYVIFGGEALKPAGLAAWHAKYPATRLINMFGITETTVHVTYKEITGKEIRANQSNIGRPIPTTTCYVMDARQQLLPVGVPGELYEGGAGVARGYLNRVALTSERFVANPYRAGETLYRSGDLVKMLPGGELEYLGRIDNQVQLRGYRIELGEIEHALLAYPGVQDVVVMLREDGGEKHICAYYTAPQQVDFLRLKEHLAGRLPGYMVPAFLVYLAQLPLTPNGKVDRQQLRLAPLTGGASAEPGPEPVGEVAQIVAEAWKKVLKRDKISIRDNFFDIGGTSLSIVMVHRALRDQLRVDVPVAALFRYPTIDAFARYLANGQPEAKKNERQEALEQGKRNRLANLERRKR
jgi:tyrocidine synthetase-3